MANPVAGGGDAGRHGQSKSGSLAESITNMVIGMAVAYVSQEIVFPLFGMPALSPARNFQMVCIFTAVSLARSFLLRRLFNWITIL